MSSSALSTIALLQKNSLAGAVQIEIERAILEGEFAPGAKLNEMDLAEKMGVSRGPVRDAFRMLDEAGLVRSEKNRGVFVRDIAIDEATEIYAIRAALEQMVGRHLAKHISPTELKELKALTDAMKLAVQGKDEDAYHALNLQFHDRMVEMTGNKKLLAMYRKLIKELSLFRRRNLSVDSAMPASAEAHRQIIKAIASGDPDRAGLALHEHVTQSMERTITNQKRSSSKRHRNAASSGNAHAAKSDAH